MAKDQLDNVNFEILWEGKPAGLWDRFLDLIHMNFTSYQITKDELIITTGFFKRHSNTFELYTLKDPDLTETLIQRWLKVGTVSVTVDAHGKTERIGTKIYLKNLKEAAKVRKLLRDAIEEDVMERKITYFDKV
ncbi:MAG TPA: PH domain-containing protein [Candidatus Scybalousia intestinigallinarum]|nr:PH domain-containing protein [Candidatus Scybalousia intestinigallinarum]